MTKYNPPLLLFFCIISLFACKAQNEKKIYEEKLIDTTLKSQIMTSDDSVRFYKEVEIMKKYVTFENNQWNVTICEDEAAKLGVSSYIYRNIIESKKTVNLFLDSIQKTSGTKFQVNY